jgi:hypothetical protein
MQFRAELFRHPEVNAVSEALCVKINLHARNLIIECVYTKAETNVLTNAFNAIAASSFQYNLIGWDFSMPEI